MSIQTKFPSQLTRYLCLKRLGGIFEDGYMYAAKSDEFNDTKESIVDEGSLFFLCFTAGAAESVAQWYMYGGIDGAGARIQISGKLLNRIIKTAKTVVGATTNKKYHLYADFVVEWNWIAYKIADKNLCLYKRGLVNFSQLNPEPWFVKDYCWNSEYEFRVVFRFNKKVNEKGIKVFLPKIFFTNVKIMAGPTYSPEKAILDLSTIKSDYSKSNIQCKMNLESIKNLR